jgi:RHS repeat-associated protein
VKYRYSFNGKEKDDEMGTQDYGMRIYDARLGRFLSVDPLTKNFPWNSTYAFAENDVIRCIDLEGGEKLEVNVTSSSSKDCAGTARIKISLDYMVVTSGVGAVTDANKLDAAQFNYIYKTGNTTLYMKSLPTPQNEPEYLSGKSLRWARKADQASSRGRREKFAKKLERAGITYYKVKVEYNYNLINKENTTLTDAFDWSQKDPNGRGVISNPVTGQNPILNETFVNSNGKAASLFNSKGDYSQDIDAQGLGSIEGVHGGSENFVFLRPKGSGNMTNNAVHEAGHNSAIDHRHKSGSYEYTSPGLSSNGDANSLTPSQSNTNSILKDKSNRSTIK